MTDRELLELAAKAAGIQIASWSNAQAGGFQTQESAQGKFWNPLNDDGDALRLAVKLRLDVTFYNGFQEVHVDTSTGCGEAACEDYSKDPAAATRRAIVRAAADIGKWL